MWVPWFSCKEKPFFNFQPVCLGRAVWTTGSTSDQQTDHIPFLQRLVCSNWLAQTKPIKVNPRLSWTRVAKLVELCKRRSTGGPSLPQYGRNSLENDYKSIQNKGKKERHRGTVPWRKAFTRLCTLSTTPAPALGLDLILKMLALNWGFYPPPGQREPSSDPLGLIFSKPRLSLPLLPRCICSSSCFPVGLFFTHQPQ